MNHPLTDELIEEKMEKLREIIATTDDPDEFDWAVWMFKSLRKEYLKQP